MHLEAEIRRLEAEFNMFFAGRLPRPPWETRARVEALVKRHDQSFIHNTADRFRFESLQNRYAKFIELWERQMTNRELGRPVRARRRAAPTPAAPARRAATAEPPDAAGGGRAPRDGARVIEFGRDPTIPSTDRPGEGAVRAAGRGARSRSAKSRCAFERVQPRWSTRRSRSSAPTAGRGVQGRR